MNRKNRWLRWILVFAVLTLVSSQTLSSAQADGPRMNASNPPRVHQLPLQLPPELPGTLSGLYRDPEGFYWSHTDQGTGIANWALRLAKLKITPSGAELLDVIPLRDEAGNQVYGDQLDPEDIAVAPDGTLWMVDEIYPLIFQVSRDGQILQRVKAPAKYSARVKGRGLEGVAVSPDGGTVYAMLQTGLSTEPDKTHTWLLAYDIATKTFKEYPYYLDQVADYHYPAGVNPWIGTNGLAATGPSELMVIERDNLSGANARVKRIYKVTVPAEPSNQPIQKELVVDLRALGYDLEKVEGLAVPHPNTMVLVNDNDANPDTPTVVWYLQW
ncbi:MAG TPA: esterase-like activity of phytase family protein [Symbiobacteriaceae bacterium]|jgi:hypothetical protein